MQGGTVFLWQTMMYTRFSRLKQHETMLFVFMPGHVLVGAGNDLVFHARMLLLSSSTMGMTLRPMPNISFALTFIRQHMESNFPSQCRRCRFACNIHRPR